MEEIFKKITEYFAHILEFVAVLYIFVAGAAATIKIIRCWLSRSLTIKVRRDVWLNFARWLILGLEFTLAADIVRTAISPTWTSIGELAAVAVIRTFLSYFLERDLEAAVRKDMGSEA